MIEGVRLVDVDIHADARGAFAEVFRHEWFPGASPMVQANLSHSNANVVRGMHVHRRQADVWIPVDGQASVGLFDLRPHSATHGESWTGALVSGEGARAVYIPAGVAHGFCAVVPFTLLYLVDRGYDGTDELGFRFDDPELSFAWPVDDPIVSDRDREAPSAADLRRGLEWG